MSWRDPLLSVYVILIRLSSTVVIFYLYLSLQVSPGPIQADRAALWHCAGLGRVRSGALQGHEPL